MTLFDEVPAEDPEADEIRATEASSRVRVRMTVAYDGSGFHGFAAQPELATVAGTLTAGLERVLGHPVELTCAGRTDAGVHARGQVISFDASLVSHDLAAVVRAVNALCAPSVVVTDAAVAEVDFDARFSATARQYRYSVWNRPHPDPFLAATTWWVPEPLDLRSMTLACDPLIGEHDFSSFCRAPKRDGEPASLVRRVIDARWEDGNDGSVHLWIEASAFCHQMVRSITGTLVEVGKGRRRAGEMSTTLRARDRHAAGQMAPAHGLCLWAVRYEPAA